MTRSSTDGSERIEGLLTMMADLAAGKLSARIPVDAADDEIAGLTTGLNMLAEELEATEFSGSRPTAAREITLQVRWDHSAPQHAVSNPVEAEQILSSLLGDAIKFGGIELGLSISRQLAQLMGGEVVLASELGEGTTVSLLLPLPGGAAPPPISEPRRADSTGLREGDGRGVRVLLVEDNELNQIAAKEMLEKLSCAVDVANNGLEALEAVQATEYDLVLMDCQMPEMDGFEATLAIRQREGGARRIPIVALTANSLTDYRELCLAIGMDDYVEKPIDPETLIGVLKRHTRARI